MQSNSDKCTTENTDRTLYFEKIRNFLNTHDKYAVMTGARIEKISEGYAEAVLPITENIINGAGVVQGGALFTLGDFAFAAASNTHGPRSVSMSANITFLRPGTGHTIKAAASVVSCGKRTCLYDVEIRNDAGKLLAKMQVNGFFLEGESIIQNVRKDLT